MRADFLYFSETDDGLLLRHVPAEQRLCHRVDLIIVRAVRELHASLWIAEDSGI
jgi:hypothetical protein